MFHNYHTVICKIAFSVSGPIDLEQNIISLYTLVLQGKIPSQEKRKHNTVFSKKTKEITWPDETPPQIGEHVFMELASNMFEVLPASPRDEGLCDGPQLTRLCSLMFFVIIIYRCKVNIFLYRYHIS